MLYLDIKNVTDTLKLMKEAEITVSAFYKLCSQTTEKYKSFWEGLSQAEISHSQNIEDILRQITEDPVKFTAGRDFEPSRIKALINEVKEKMNQVRNGKLAGNKIFLVARNFENSIIESKYGELVKSDKTGFLSAFREILRQTIEHKEMIESKIKELNILSIELND